MFFNTFNLVLFIEKPNFIFFSILLFYNYKFSIGERSNFIKLFLIIVISIIIYFFYTYNLKKFINSYTSYTYLIYIFLK